MSLGLRVMGAGIGAVAALGVVFAVPSPARADNAVAPSVLTLTVGDGESLDAATDQRTVLLICSPLALGTHPQTARACEELWAAGGDFGELKGEPMRFCPFIYKPITVAAEGIWNGISVSYHRTFPNRCVEQNTNRYVFAF
ncbi:subtilase-type protease inhibitor [Nocardia vinacea]|uniref:subtilase-type protease inhibitor n=1 Tax=Nocardia vinacea TaxID=96468 RepID=UPI000593F534|nr:subtilase-type protease inhibitor [Nocardia vinacea]